MGGYTYQQTYWASTPAQWAFIFTVLECISFFPPARNGCHFPQGAPLHMQCYRALNNQHGLLSLGHKPHAWAWPSFNLRMLCAMCVWPPCPTGCRPVSTLGLYRTAEGDRHSPLLAWGAMHRLFYLCHHAWPPLDLCVPHVCVCSSFCHFSLLLKPPKPSGFLCVGRMH